MTLPDAEVESLMALVPAELKLAIVTHVRAGQQTEMLLDVAEQLEALRATPARAGQYVSDVIASLSQLRDVDQI